MNSRKPHKLYHGIVRSRGRLIDAAIYDRGDGRFQAFICGMSFNVTRIEMHERLFRGANHPKHEEVYLTNVMYTLNDPEDHEILKAIRKVK